MGSASLTACAWDIDESKVLKLHSFEVLFRVHSLSMNYLTTVVEMLQICPVFWSLNFSLLGFWCPVGKKGLLSRCCQLHNLILLVSWTIYLWSLYCCGTYILESSLWWTRFSWTMKPCKQLNWHLLLNQESVEALNEALFWVYLWRSCFQSLGPAESILESVSS